MTGSDRVQMKTEVEKIEFTSHSHVQKIDFTIDNPSTILQWTNQTCKWMRKVPSKAMQCVICGIPFDFHLRKQFTVLKPASVLDSNFTDSTSTERPSAVFHPRLKRADYGSPRYSVAGGKLWPRSFRSRQCCGGSQFLRFFNFEIDTHVWRSALVHVGTLHVASWENFSVRFDDFVDTREERGRMNRSSPSPAGSNGGSVADDSRIPFTLSSSFVVAVESTHTGAPGTVIRCSWDLCRHTRRLFRRTHLVIANQMPAKYLMKEFDNCFRLFSTGWLVLSSVGNFWTIFILINLQS